MNSRQNRLSIRQKAIEFANKYNLLNFDCFTLQQILEQCGYRVLEYSDDFVKTADALKDLDSQATGIADVFLKENIRCVFVRKSLPEEDKAVLLAEQTGIIVLLGGIENITDSQRYDCLTFSLYLRDLCKEKGVGAWFTRHKTGALATVAMLLLVACMSLSSVVLYFSTLSGTVNPLDSLTSSVDNALAPAQTVQVDIFDNNAVAAFSPVDLPLTEGVDGTVQNSDVSEETGEEYFYVTKSGKKYHISSCTYIKDISACSKVSKEDILQKGYEPCKRCIKG